MTSLILYVIRVLIEAEHIQILPWIVFHKKNRILSIILVQKKRVMTEFQSELLVVYPIYPIVLCRWDSLKHLGQWTPNWLRLFCRDGIIRGVPMGQLETSWTVDFKLIASVLSWRDYPRSADETAWNILGSWLQTDCVCSVLTNTGKHVWRKNCAVNHDERTLYRGSMGYVLTIQEIK